MTGTQLAWKMEAVQRSPAFPLGVRTWHRAFANDCVFEIVPDNSNNNPVGLKAVRTHCRWEPRPSPDNQNIGGMYILQSIPRGPIHPAEFIEGSRAKAEQTIRDFKNQYPSKLKAIQEWEEFLDAAPANDNVWEYVSRSGGHNSLYVPLRESLFSGIALQLQPPPEHLPEVSFRPDRDSVLPSTAHLENVSATPSVQWSGRGLHLPFYPARVENSTGEGVEELRELSALTVRDYKSLSKRELTNICNARKLTVATDLRKEDLVNR